MVVNKSIWVISDEPGGLKNQTIAAAKNVSEKLGCEVKDYNFFDIHKAQGADNFVKNQLSKQNIPVAIFSTGVISSTYSSDIHNVFLTPKICHEAKKAISSKNITFVHFQKPETEHDHHLDLIILSSASLYPENDKRQHVMLGTATHLNDKILIEAYNKNESYFDKDKKYCTVLIGGDTESGELGAQDAQKIAKQLIAYSQQSGMDLIINFSPRSNPEFYKRMNGVFLKENFKSFKFNEYYASEHRPKVEGLFEASIWRSENLIVTGDSISMMSEATATGKPTEVYLGNSTDNKCRQLFYHLVEEGVAKEFDGNYTAWKDNDKKFDVSGSITSKILDTMRIKSKERLF